MVERPSRGYFGGLWVFPGGAVEDQDRSDLARRTVAAPTDCEDFEWRAAALRETVEEVGLAITETPLTEALPESGVYAHLDRIGVRLDATRLRFVSQWVTPEGAPSRYDARFYLALVDGHSPLTPQSGEVVSARWIGAAGALEAMDRQEWAMVLPTTHHLHWLTRYSDTERIWEAATVATGARVQPIVERDGSEVRVRLPDWAELP